MTQFFASIGVLLVIYLCFVGYVKYMESNNEREHHLFELYYGMPWRPGYQYSYSKIKEYFKNHPEELKNREEEWKIRQHEKYIKKEKKILKTKEARMFAYEYEDALFQLYAPSAKIFGGVWHSDTQMPKKDIVSIIVACKHVSEEEAEIIFDKLVEYKIILNSSMGEYKLGLINTLSNWNIVSNNDMNLDKWMTKNGYEHK